MKYLMECKQLRTIATKNFIPYFGMLVGLFNKENEACKKDDVDDLSEQSLGQRFLISKVPDPSFVRSYEGAYLLYMATHRRKAKVTLLDLAERLETTLLFFLAAAVEEGNKEVVSALNLVEGINHTLSKKRVVLNIINNRSSLSLDACLAETIMIISRVRIDPIRDLGALADEFELRSCIRRRSEIPPLGRLVVLMMVPQIVYLPDSLLADFVNVLETMFTGLPHYLSFVGQEAVNDAITKHKELIDQMSQWKA